MSGRKRPQNTSGRPEKNRGAAGGRFTKGVSGNPHGRRPGVPNKATQEVREVCAAIIHDPAYRQKLHARAISGDLTPAVETMLWYYLFGKPKERVDLTSGGQPIVFQVVTNVPQPEANRGRR